MIESQTEENMQLKNLLVQVKDTIEKLKDAKKSLVESEREKNF